MPTSPWKTVKLPFGPAKKPAVPASNYPVYYKPGTPVAGSSGGRADPNYKPYVPPKAGTPSTVAPPTFSVTPILKGIADWKKVNPNASDYWHAYAPGGNTDIGALMREDPQGYLAAYQAYNPIDGGAGAQQLPPGYAGAGSSGGGRGGGGGGGGAAAGGLDQGTLDYLSSIIGLGKPKDISYEALDLPDPGDYMTWNNDLYNQARQGVTTGIEGIRGRGNTAFDQAQGELSRYTNPFEGGLQTRNPDLQNAMQRMMSANSVQPGSVGATDQEATQADRGMANVLAMLAGTDQARQAGNARALQGDRTTFEQNLGLEGNMMNLGVNMAEAKGKSSFDQALQAARLNAANQESQTNWTRRNTVGDTNVGGSNAWMQNALQAYMSLIGQKAPGVTLPANGTLPWQV